MKDNTSFNTAPLLEQLKALSHPKKLQIVIYLRSAGVATNAVISKQLACSKSCTSKLTSDLVSSGLVIREKVFTSTQFKLNNSKLAELNSNIAQL